MEIINYEEFSANVENKLRSKIEEGSVEFWKEKPRWKKFIFSWWKYVVVFLLTFLLFGILFGVSLLATNDTVIGMAIALIISLLIGTIVTFVFVKLRFKYSKMLREAINEKDLVYSAFEMDPMLARFDEDVDKNAKDGVQTIVWPDLEISGLFDYERSMFGIPREAYIKSYNPQYNLIVKYKHADFFAVRTMVYEWIDVDEKGNQHRHQKEAATLEYIINEGNINEGNDFDFTLFWEKSNIKLESTEFNKKVKLNVKDQINARVLFTPVMQEKILEYMKKSLLNRFGVTKKGPLFRITFVPFRGHLIIEGNKMSDHKQYVDSTVVDLKKDIYSIIELQRFVLYNGMQNTYSYKVS